MANKFLEDSAVSYRGLGQTLYHLKCKSLYFRANFFTSIFFKVMFYKCGVNLIYTQTA